MSATVPTKVEFDALTAKVATVSAAQVATAAELVTAEQRITTLEAVPVPPPVVAPPVITNPLTVPDLTVIATTDTTLSIRFTEVSDGAGLPASYEIRSTPGVMAWGAAPPAGELTGSVVGAPRVFVLTNLTPGTNYQVQLVAYRGTLNVDAVFGELSNIASGATAVIVGPPVVIPPPSSAVWPNAPAGWTTVYDSPLTAIPGGGWNSSGPVLVSDPTAPVSPPGVAEYRYPQGKQGGAGVGSLWRPWPAGMDSHYLGYTFKLSNPFDNRFGFKQWYPGPNGPGYYFMVVEGGVPPYDLRIEGPVGQVNNYSNIQKAQVQVGVWHQLEILFEGGSRLRWWLDNVLCGDHPIGWHMQGVAEARLDSTWGGVNNTIAFDSRWWADHLFLSRP